MTRNDTLVSLAVNSWINGGRVNWPGADLIDDARLEGIRLGLEAAEKKVWSANWNAALRVDENAAAIRALDPETIAREADLTEETAR